MLAQPAFVAFASRDALMAATAHRIGDALRSAIAERGQACAALSGGSTPEKAYALLAQAPLDWNKVTFALVDERFVPPSHAASNEAMLRRALAPALANGAELAPLWREAASAKDAADTANAAYAALSFDIAVMGMGEDGHTASWFPSSAGLNEALDPTTTRTVVPIHAPQAAGAADRLTLTGASISKAGALVLVMAGVEKQRQFEAIVGGTNDRAPVATLLGPDMPPLEVFWAP